MELLSTGPEKAIPTVNSRNALARYAACRHAAMGAQRPKAMSYSFDSCFCRLLANTHTHTHVHTHYSPTSIPALRNARTATPRACGSGCSNPTTTREMPASTRARTAAPSPWQSPLSRFR
eukprot:1159815-Pelagomonas_calceolata.AAC.9